MPVANIIAGVLHRELNHGRKASPVYHVRSFPDKLCLPFPGPRHKQITAVVMGPYNEHTSMKGF